MRKKQKMRWRQFVSCMLVTSMCSVNMTPLVSFAGEYLKNRPRYVSFELPEALTLKDLGLSDSDSTSGKTEQKDTENTGTEKPEHGDSGSNIEKPDTDDSKDGTEKPDSDDSEEGTEKPDTGDGEGGTATPDDEDVAGDNDITKPTTGDSEETKAPETDPSKPSD